MDALWSWRAVCEAMGVSPSDGPDISGISIDSRTLNPGDLFIALRGDPGERFNTSHQSELDGHDYVQQAFDAGAAGVLIHQEDICVALEKYQTADSSRVILVEDTLDGLWDLARAARRRLCCPVFAITGSSGKTTLRNFLGACLETEVAPGSLNNFWGLPLSMARTPAHCSAAIFELGTSSPGEIEPLAELVQPDVAVVLNVLPAHIEFFSDLAAIEKEKLSIMYGLTRDGVLVLPHALKKSAMNANDSLVGWQEGFEKAANVRKERIQLITFGDEQSANIHLQSFDLNSPFLELTYLNQKFQANVPGGGQHRAHTVAATLACIIAADLDPGSIQKLGNIQPPGGRGNVLSVFGVKVIDESYNANPTSMAAALNNLSAASKEKKYAILGDMLELGSDAGRFHKEMLASCTNIDGIFCVGKQMRSLFESLPVRQRWGYAENISAMDLGALVIDLSEGDCVLVKGSNRIFWSQDFVGKLTQALTDAAQR